MRFSKKAGRGTALVALAAASTLFAAGCSAGSLGSAAAKAVPAPRQSRSSPAPQTPTLRARRR